MTRLSSSDRSEPALARTPGKPINVGFEAVALAVRPAAHGDVAAADRPRGRAVAGLPADAHQAGPTGDAANQKSARRRLVLVQVQGRAVVPMSDT
jgi:hypothetical protein